MTYMKKGRSWLIGVRYTVHEGHKLFFFNITCIMIVTKLDLANHMATSFSTNNL